MKNKQNNRQDNGTHRRPNKLSFADEWEEEEEEQERDEVEQIEIVVNKASTQNEEVGYTHRLGPTASGYTHRLGPTASGYTHRLGPTTRGWVHPLGVLLTKCINPNFDRL